MVKATDSLLQDSTLSECHSEVVLKLLIWWILDPEHTSFSFFNMDFFYFLFFYCSGFCDTLKWNSHGFTCVPHPDPPSHLPLHPIPLIWMWQNASIQNAFSQVLKYGNYCFKISFCIHYPHTSLRILHQHWLGMLICSFLFHSVCFRFSF